MSACLLRIFIFFHRFEFFLPVLVLKHLRIVFLMVTCMNHNRFQQTLFFSRTPTLVILNFLLLRISSRWAHIQCSRPINLSF
ncbi:hypothetical protein HanIR_Chr07g0306411 [Helianthus annuus]|nr:hypothetical protein HanIR_Chr07g0306411 [Helianthus annuus]